MPDAILCPTTGTSQDTPDAPCRMSILISTLKLLNSKYNSIRQLKRVVFLVAERQFLCYRVF